MSKKRSKILLAMSILVITIFLIVQFIFQRINLIPQLPSSMASLSNDMNDGGKIVIISQNNDFIVKDNVKQSGEKIPSKLVQDQVGESLIAHNKQSDQQPDQSSIVTDKVNVSQSAKDGSMHKQKSKPEENDVMPEKSMIKEEIKQKLKASDNKLLEIKSPETELTNSKSLKEFKIILWTTFFRDKNYVKNWEINCAHTNCRFTSNRDSYHQADAIMFHQSDLEIKDLPKLPRDPNQRWIYLNHESPPHGNSRRAKVLNNKINLTVTYRLESDFLLSPVFVPVPEVLPEVSVNHTRSGMVAWLVSNCNTIGNRESFIEELKKHIQVDVYGACGNLTCLPKMSKECYETLSRKYYFYLSFENSLCPDYVTEKLFSVLNYPIVPVVFGGADYCRMAPPNSYIDALSFESPAKLAEYLIHLTQTPEDYDNYFNWKRYYVQTYSHYGCQICSALNQPKKSRKTIDNLYKWWYEDAPCKRWEKHGLVQVTP